MNALRIGARSLGRNKRRTLVTTAAMALAGIIMIFYAALLNGFTDTLERNALRMETGDVQIHAPGYRRDPDLYRRVPDPLAVVGRLEQAGLLAAPRLYGFGLAAAGRSSAGVQLRGIDVAHEDRVTLLHTHVAEGQWLDPSAPTGVVVGKKLAKSLHVKLGDEVVLVGQAADGSMANALYTVRGILAGVGEELDRGGLFMTEGAFRDLMVVPDGAHEIAAVRPDRSMSLEEATRRAAAAAPGMETSSWKTLKPALARMLESTLASQAFMLLITYAAVAMVVLNATLMSVFERIREFGVMRALGVSPLGVARVVLAEVLTQGVLAMGLAVVGGYALSGYFEHHGIDLRGLVNDASLVGITFDPVWYTRVTSAVLWIPAVSLLAVVLLAALYPGIKAAVIAPAEAMHHV
ncbi:MAG: ABC transporter permease [Myxococcales bacterium]|nr:ABC transporter permease [Myxococcales bacterium]